MVIVVQSLEVVSVEVVFVQRNWCVRQGNIFFVQRNWCVCQGHIFCVQRDWLVWQVTIQLVGNAISAEHVFAIEEIDLLWNRLLLLLWGNWFDCFILRLWLFLGSSELLTIWTLLLLSAVTLALSVSHSAC